MTGRKPSVNGRTSRLWWITQVFATLIWCSVFATADQIRRYNDPNTFLSSVNGWKREDKPSPSSDRSLVASKRPQRHLQLQPTTSRVEYLTPDVKIQRFLEPVSSPCTILTRNVGYHLPRVPDQLQKYTQLVVLLQLGLQKLHHTHIAERGSSATRRMCTSAAADAYA